MTLIGLDFFFQIFLIAASIWAVSKQVDKTTESPTSSESDSDLDIYIMHHQQDVHPDTFNTELRGPTYRRTPATTTRYVFH